MKISIVDYKHPKRGYANRDQTGGFGSGMHSEGFIGKLIEKIKRDRIRVPVITIAYVNAIAKETNNNCYVSSEFPEKSDLILIASSMINWEFEVNIAKKIREKYKDSKIGFFGPFASEYPEKFESVSDFILIGEPENAFQKICVGSEKPEGWIFSQSIENLDELPFPSWEGFNIDEFSYSPALRRKPFLTIQGSRGCPFACDFCPYIVNQGIKLRRRNNLSIICEITNLVEKYKTLKNI